MTPARTHLGPRFPISLLDVVVVGAAGSLALLVKAAFSDAAPGAFRWLLAPTVAALEWLTEATFVWESGVGYASVALRYWVVPACSGVTFLAVCVGVLPSLLATGRETVAARCWWFLASLGFALTATLAANTIRLVTALEFHRAGLELPGIDAAELHRLLGIAVYLLALLAVVELARLRTRPSERLLRVSALAAVGWYLALTLVIPALRGRSGSPHFMSHAVWVLGCSVGALALRRLVWRWLDWRRTAARPATTAPLSQ